MKPGGKRPESEGSVESVESPSLDEQRAAIAEGRCLWCERGIKDICGHCGHEPSCDCGDCGDCEGGQ